jgi:hypothetical protein
MLRLMLVAAAFAALGLVICVSLRPASERPVVQGAAAASAKPALQVIQIEVDFVHAPAQFRVQHLGQTVMEGKGPQLNFSREVTLALPREGIELVLEAAWPKGAPETAVRLRCTKDGEVITDRTYWGRGELAQVVLVR